MKKGITRREFEVTDRKEILEILDKCKIVHVGMVDGDEPYVVPMNYGYIMDDDQLVLYLHGAVKGRKMSVLTENPKVFIEMNCDIKPFDGKLACQYGTSYASLMGKGTAEIVEDIQVKKEALSLLMKTQTGKDFEFNDKMADIVGVIKVTVDEYTAKRRPLPKTPAV